MILLTSDELVGVRNIIRGRTPSAHSQNAEKNPKIDSKNGALKDPKKDLKDNQKNSSGNRSHKTDQSMEETQSSHQKGQIPKKIKNLRATDEDLFTTLYKTWCFNPVSTLSLCLLAKKYCHSQLFVQSFAQIEMTVNFLVHIYNMVQILESPIFVELRMQLLEPLRHPYLLKSLYGILMLLPQSSAHEKLNNRLQSVNAMYFVVQNSSFGNHFKDSKSLNESNEDEAENEEYQILLDHFKQLQWKRAE